MMTDPRPEPSPRFKAPRPLLIIVLVLVLGFQAEYTPEQVGEILTIVVASLVALAAACVLNHPLAE
ncbi:hypothetical protein [Streptosporangium sp. NPDC000509]|uniref:hypothetical protein n=1 Tax=Streptosporangium sp. NPDC000509 TaxID=3366186 RepID=UPI0036CFAD57